MLVILTALPHLKCHVSKSNPMYGAIGDALSLKSISSTILRLNPANRPSNLPRHQAQVNSPYHTKKTSHQQSLVDWDNGEVENRYKWPKFEAGDHDGPKLLMTSNISHCWCTFAYVPRIACHASGKVGPGRYSRGNADPEIPSPRVHSSST